MTEKERRKKHAQQAAVWRLAHPEKVKESQRKYRQLHSGAIKQSRRKWSANLRAELFVAYGNRCLCCGESQQAFLVVDHIGGGGSRHRKSLGNKGGAHFYLWLKRNGFPPEFQILCANCNMAKGYQGICPHQSHPHPQRNPAASSIQLSILGSVICWPLSANGQAAEH